MNETEQPNLRDFFAASAIQGWLASFGDDHEHPARNPGLLRTLARFSYVVADAMIAERKRGK